MRAAHAADAEQLRALEEDSCEVDLRGFAEQLAYQRVATVQRKAVEALIEYTTADVVDDDVGTLGFRQGTHLLGKAAVAVHHDDVVRAAQMYFKPSNRTVGYYIPDRSPDRTVVPAAPDLNDTFRNYTSKVSVVRGESFDPTISNIESRIVRSKLPNGMKVSVLSKKTANNMVSATLNDAWVRTEHYRRESKTTFYQVGGSWDQDLGDTFRFTLLGGISKSNADIPVETTFVFDDRDAQGYSFDYSDMRSPKLTFGTSVTDPANFQLAEIRDRPSNVTNKFRTAQLRTIRAPTLERRPDSSDSNRPALAVHVLLDLQLVGNVDGRDGTRAGRSGANAPGELGQVLALPSRR